MLGIKNAKEYLEKIYNIDINTIEFDKAEGLPLFLRKSFRFIYYNVFNQLFLAVEVLDLDLSFREVKAIEKNLRKYIEINESILIILNKNNEYIRRECIKEGIAFIVPGIELYFPKLGLMYSQFLKKSIIYNPVLNDGQKLSSVAQALLFEIDRGMNNTNQKMLADKLGYSTMSISRAMKELIGFELVHRDDNRNFVISKPLVDLVIEDKALFINPIQKKVFIDVQFNVGKFELFVNGGESELANKSMLIDPRNHTYCIYKVDWKEYEAKVDFLQNDKDHCHIIQIWKYPITMLKDKIHPLALYLSLMDEKDERILKELEILIEEYKNDKKN